MRLNNRTLMTLVIRGCLSSGWFLLLSSCGGASSPQETAPHTGTETVSADADATETGKTEAEADADAEHDADGQVAIESNSTEIAPAHSSGSKMRLLGARALTTIYARVFPKQAFGYMHCQEEKNRPVESTDCTDSIFSIAERPFTGSFDLNSPLTRRGNQNVNPADNLTLNYTRTLRAALSRECTQLVRTEMDNLKAKRTDPNSLIKSADVKPADIDHFFRKLQGMEGTNFPIGLDSAAYAEAFRVMVNSNKDKNAGRTEAYSALCLALSMDPMVILY